MHFCARCSILSYTRCNSAVSIRGIYNLFTYFTICIFNSSVLHNDMSSHYCIFFVEYLPEDDHVRPKHVGGLPHACILLYVITVQLFVCVLHIYLAFLGIRFDTNSSTADLHRKSLVCT